MLYALPEMEATSLRPVVEVIEDRQPEIIETLAASNAGNETADRFDNFVEGKRHA